MKIKNLLFTLIGFLPLLLTGCNNTNQPSEPTTGGSKIVLSSASVELVVGENYHLTIAYMDVDRSLPTTYVSNNENVVTVTDNGVVTGVSAGSASVLVTKGEASATCTFNVSYASQIPLITVNGIQNNSLELDVTSEFTFDIGVNFGGISYDISNPTLTIEEGGTGKATIEGTTIKPSQEGNLTLKIDGEFRDFDLHPYYIDVLIKESVYFTLTEHGEDPREYIVVDLYSVSELHGKQYKNSFKPKLSVFVNGVDHSNEITFEFENANNVISYESSTNTITPVKAGTAYLVATYLTYSKTFPINVNYANAGEVDDTTYVIDASVGEFDSEEIFTDFPGDTTITKATSVDGSVEYEVKDGKVLGIRSINFAEQEILLYNSKVFYKVTFKAYAKIIKTAEDLECFLINFGTDTNKVQNFQNDGYYLLNNDIDCSGITYTNHTRILGIGVGAVKSSCGFVGTFDGQGHTIYNYKAPKGGMFLVLGNGATVKNVAFKNAILDTQKDNDKFVLATYVYAAEIHDVYIQSNSDIYTVNNALVAGCVTKNARVHDCLFEFGGVIRRDDLNSGFGSFMHISESGAYPTSFLLNCYLISQLPMTVEKNKYHDSIEFDELSSFEYTPYPNIKHYLNEQEMIDDSNDFSSFNSKYWDYTTNPGRLTWKIN